MAKKYVETKGGILTGEIVKTDKDVYGLCATCIHSFRHEYENEAKRTQKTSLCLSIGAVPIPIPTKKCSHHETEKKETTKSE